MALFLLSSDNFVSLGGIPIKQVTQVQTLCEVFNQQQTYLTKVHKLLKLYLTIPTTASSGCIFLALKHIKTYLMNSMTQQHLNHCMVFIRRERMPST